MTINPSDSVTSGLHTPDAVVYPSPVSPAGDHAAACALAQDFHQFTGEWAFIRVIGAHERKAASLFIRDGVQIHLPMYRAKVRDETGRLRDVEEPLFSNYVFLCGDPEQTWYDRIRRHTSGGKRIVTMAQKIHDQAQFVEQLTAVEEELAANRIRPYKLPIKGDRCRILEGAFRGSEGTVERAGDQRLFVFRIFGQAKVMELEPHKLELLD